jgi:hypothetical protein
MSVRIADTLTANSRITTDKTTTVTLRRSLHARIAIAAVGLTSMLAGIIKIGMRPFALGLFAAVLIGGVSLALIGALAQTLISAVGL